MSNTLPLFNALWGIHAAPFPPPLRRMLQQHQLCGAADRRAAALSVKPATAWSSIRLRFAVSPCALTLTVMGNRLPPNCQ